MSSLSLTFSNKRGRNSEYTFQAMRLLHDAVATSESPNDLLHCSVKQVLHQGHSRVYRCHLEGGDAKFPQDVVCKVVFGKLKRIQKEAEFYTTTLRDVQGTSVSRFLGLFTGVSPYSRKPAACLMTEYAGAPLRGGDWSGVSDVTRCAFSVLSPLTFS